MLKKTIYIPIEIKSREFRSQVLLAKYAADKSFRIYIGTKNGIDLLIRKKNKGGVYLYKGGHYKQYMEMVKKSCDIFAVLDQEIGPITENYEESIPLRFYSETTHLVDRYYAVSKDAADAAEKAITDFKQKIVLTGWPRIDLWEKKFRHIHIKSQELSEKYGEFFLYASSFGVNSERMLHSVFRMYNEEAINGLKDKFQEWKWGIEKSLADFNGFVEILEKWDSDPEIPLIIVRPHPGEDLEAWYSATKDMNKVKCIFEGAIDDWLYASKGLLQRNCTTSLQAYMSGIPLGYVAIDKDEESDDLPYKLSRVIRGPNDLKKWVNDALTGKFEQTQINQQLKNEIEGRAYISRKTAAEHIVDDLLNLKITTENAHSGKNLRIFFFRLSRKILGMKSNVNKMKNFGSKKGLSWNHVAPHNHKVAGGITKKEVQFILKELDHNQKYKVRQVFTNCVEIERDFP